MKITDLMQLQVAEFHEKFGAPIGERPANVSFPRAQLRARLILEETVETVVALVGTSGARRLFSELSLTNYHTPSLVEVADGMCDTLYVVHGAAIEMGIDLAPLFDEVHRTNMAKEGGAIRADGKILKPAGWQKPRIAELLREQGASEEDLK